MDEIKPVAMTQPETVSVTQADRHAAAEYLADIVPTMPRLADEVRTNQTALARAFARHRIAAEQALSAMPSGLLADREIASTPVDDREVGNAVIKGLLAEAVECLEEIADMTKRKQLPLTSMVHDTARAFLAKIGGGK